MTVLTVEEVAREAVRVLKHAESEWTNAGTKTAAIGIGLALTALALAITGPHKVYTEREAP